MDWIDEHKEGLVTVLVILMLCFIIFNQVTYTDTNQYFYIGEVKDAGIRWEGGSTKTAVIWFSFNDSTILDFHRYEYDSYDVIKSNASLFNNKFVIVTYEKIGNENRLLSVFELPF